MEIKVILALAIVIALVVGVNGYLLAALRKGRSFQHIQLLQKAARRARDPWQPENKDLAELSRLVSQFKDSGENAEEQK
jgi:hypothetical protein